MISLRGAVAVLTIPGCSAKNTNPSFLNSAAYFATTIFAAAFEIEYAGKYGDSDCNVQSRSPAPELIVITFLIVPARRRGRKALMVCATPMTLVSNCKQKETIISASRKSRDFTYRRAQVLSEQRLCAFGTV